MVASETMTTVASKARTALTPSSSNTIPPCTACAQGVHAGLRGAPQLAGLGGQSLALAGEALRILPRETHLRAAPAVGQAVQHELGEAQALAEGVGR